MMNRKCHWFYHAILCGAALLASIAPSLAQQKVTQKRGPLVLVSTAPQHLLFGINLGVERVLSPKFSLGADLTAHLWLLEMPNMAISPMVKYYFTGTVGSGIYTRAKAVAGYFLALQH